MKWIRRTVLDREIVSGTFLNLGSSVTAELAGNAGFDWLLIDIEHGAGDRQELLRQLQALESTPSAPIVRLGGSDPVLIKRVLDLGVSGLMIPLVNSAEEARHVVESMLYPPRGVRGVASSTRAARFGEKFDEYFAQANDELLVVVQIETARALENLEEIAAVDRVDVIFLGPLDLSVSLGCPKDFDDARFRAAVERIVAVAREYGKASGVLAMNAALASRYIDDGFTFVACGSDGGAVAAGLRENADVINTRK